VEGQIPPAERQRLHQKAAGLVADQGRALTHRMMATPRYDDDLADELAGFAWDLHLQRRNREAGAYLRRASRVSSAAAVRESRWLDALFEATLARDIDAVEAELPQVTWASDRARAQLVQAFVLIVRKRWLQAVDVLDGVDDPITAAADDYVLYRLLALHGWARLVTGAPDDRVLPVLERARSLAASDPGFTGYLTFAYAMARRASAADDPTIPTDARQQLYAAAWRGAAAAITGEVDAAVRDLDGFTSRIDTGAIDMGDGVFHALLGLALWLRGDWRRSSIALDVAQGARFGGNHPMVQAILPLTAIVAGDQERARTLMQESREALRAAPWPQALVASTITDTFALALAGTAEDRRSYRSGIFRDFGATDLPGTLAPLGILNSGVAAYWAGDLAGLDQLTARLRRAPQRWVSSGVAWLEGLAADVRGDHRAAAELLCEARRAWPDSLRLHRWILLTQTADVLAASGDTRGAGTLREDAAVILRAVGGAAWLPDEEDPLAQLSDREKDVVALVAEGLSYAQIANELYLSRSTVAFHLSNAYGKTGTSSRHELVQLIRRTSPQN
jgi:DNA-binding CsgD family transcriptional regulator